MADARKPLIGFIGQGFIGKNYADDFEQRGFTVVRYALEEPYIGNKEKIAGCDIVFIAVPTPTTPEGFDYHILREALPLVGIGKIAVVKSTTLPGTIKKLQEANPDIVLLHSPEFLSEATAAHDAGNPFSNIVGIARDEDEYRKAAEVVMSILPRAPYSLICDSTETEVIKYTHNISAYMQIVAFNMFYDVARSHGLEWEHIHEAIKADPFISNRYAQPVHKSGRGAGGHCFIKDAAAFREHYEAQMPDDKKGSVLLRSLECKNNALLTASGKDIALLQGVYGEHPEDICAS